MLVVVATGPKESRDDEAETHVFGPYRIKQFAWEDAERIEKELGDKGWSVEVRILVASTQEHSVGDFISDFIARRKDA